MENSPKYMTAVSCVVNATKQCIFTWSFKDFCDYPIPTIQSSQGVTVRHSRAPETTSSSPFAIDEGKLRFSFWKLLLNPCIIINGQEYIGVYLQKNSGFGTSEVQFKVCLLDEVGEKLNVRERDHIFKTFSFFGWDNFISRKSLIGDKSFLLADGTLSVCCEMAIKQNIEINHGKVESIVQKTDENQTELASKSQDDETFTKNRHVLFKELYDKKTGCDVILRVGDKKFDVHKVILSAYSPVLAKKFQNLDAEGNCVDLDDKAPVIEQVIQYIYCGECTKSPEMLLLLYECADKYKISELVKKCSDCLIDKLNMDCACQIAISAYLLSDTTLLDAAKNFIISTPLEVMASVPWKKLLNEYSSLAQDIISYIPNTVPEIKPCKIEEGKNYTQPFQLNFPIAEFKFTATPPKEP